MAPNISSSNEYGMKNITNQLRNKVRNVVMCQIHYTSSDNLLHQVEDMSRQTYHQVYNRVRLVISQVLRKQVLRRQSSK